MQNRTDLPDTLVSVFLAMFDMPDVAKVFCPGAPEVSDDPQTISAQARAIIRAKAGTPEPSTGDGHPQEPDKWPGDDVAEAEEAAAEPGKKPDGGDEEKKPIPAKPGARAFCPPSIN